MNYFNIPADFKKSTLDAFEILNQKYKDATIIETYGNITEGVNFGSGRVMSQLPKIDLFDLQEYVEYAKEKKIEFCYTLNIPFMQNKEFTREGASKLINFLGDLYQTGVRSLILSMPSLVELVKSTRYDFKIKASAICHITNANKARAYKNMGVDKIVIDESVHRDFKTLKQIRRVFGKEVEIIVNTMCHRNCIYRSFHYNETGGDSTGKSNAIGVNFFEHKCMLQRYSRIDEILKLAWVRPEDLKYYSGIGINYFKLQGRQHVLHGDQLKAIECYLKQDYQGNLMELLDMFNTRYSFKVFLDNKKLDGFLKPFYEKDNFCRNDCEKCLYCMNFARKCINFPAAEKVIKSARVFYKEYDQYRDILNPENNSHKKSSKGVDLDINFELN